MPNSIEQRLFDLEELVKKMCEGDTLDLTNELMDDAKVMALYSIVLELAEKAGVTTEDFSRHFDIRFRWWHDHYLKRAEGISPGRAAELDPRTIEQAAVEATYPSIFSPPPPE